MKKNNVHRALNRFGLGVGPELRDAASDPRGWLHAQLESKEAPLQDQFELSDDKHVAQQFDTLREAQQAQDQEKLETARQSIQQSARAEAHAALTMRITSSRPFVERLVAFWSNHLCISITSKPILSGLAGPYERNAIRPHVLGSFEHMVTASAQHPAMLLYLDNAQSIGPSSQAARWMQRRARGQERGLNENYARELLELHTLGVDGGYTQDDVRELARILTGWTINRTPTRQRQTGQPIAFRFASRLHEPGSKEVLGVTYEPSGEKEGKAVIRDLAHHPSTARFIAHKLAVHFVADEPPLQAVQTLERAFKDSEGDLKHVAAALIDLEAAWDPSYRKFKTPQEWLISVGRTLDMDEAPELFPRLLRQLRQPLWGPQAPKGYGSLVREWADPDALMNRAELSRSIARFAARHMDDPAALIPLFDLDEQDPLPSLLDDKRIPKQERLALAFAAPAFQWR